MGDVEGCRDNVNGTPVNGSGLYLGPDNQSKDSKEDSGLDEALKKAGEFVKEALEMTRDSMMIGDVLGHASDNIDALVISGNFTAGFVNQYVTLGMDIVATEETAVLFVSGGYHILDDGLDPGLAGAEQSAMTPQLGGTGTFGTLASSILKNDPSRTGIEDAFSGLARQEGFTLGSFTVNHSSSADPVTGRPDYKTTAQAIGFSGGFVETIGEYHTYTTGSRPVKEIRWTALKAICYPHC